MTLFCVIVNSKRRFATKLFLLSSRFFACIWCGKLHNQREGIQGNAKPDLLNETSIELYFPRVYHRCVSLSSLFSLFAAFFGIGMSVDWNNCGLVWQTNVLTRIPLRAMRVSAFFWCWEPVQIRSVFPAILVPPHHFSALSPRSWPWPPSRPSGYSIINEPKMWFSRS